MGDEMSADVGYPKTVLVFDTENLIDGDTSLYLKGVVDKKDLDYGTESVAVYKLSHFASVTWPLPILRNETPKPKRRKGRR